MPFKNNSLDRTPLSVRCGMMSGIVGITVNLLLFAGKIYAGNIANSIAVRADAFNNLSDAASGIVTVLAVVLSSRPADKKHPFGHGRFEYICSMAVTFMIFLMGYELASSSVAEILHPQKTVFGIIPALILAVSVVAKLFLALFNIRLGKKVGSTVLSATAADSFADAAATTVTLISLVFSRYSDIPTDGYLGLAVAIFIFAAGVRLFKESSDPLIGKPPEKELIRTIEEKILSYEHVEGIHDLIIHEYGANKKFGTVHVETDARCDVLEIHDTIDLIEQDVFSETGIHLVIHHDPLEIGNERVEELKKLTVGIVRELDSSFSIHDFRVAESPVCINLIFDLTVPFGCKYTENELSKMINEKLQAVNGELFAVVSAENGYI